jgi:hypothetical protein
MGGLVLNTLFPTPIVDWLLAWVHLKNTLEVCMHLADQLICTSSLLLDSTSSPWTSSWRKELDAGDELVRIQEYVEVHGGGADKTVVVIHRSTIFGHM